MLLVVRNDAVHLKWSLRYIGYELAAASEAVPLLLAYTEDEWKNHKKRGAPFPRAVERDAVRVS